jgi:hypothetical protein
MSIIYLHFEPKEPFERLKKALSGDTGQSLF